MAKQTLFGDTNTFSQFYREKQHHTLVNMPHTINSRRKIITTTTTTTTVTIGSVMGVNSDYMKTLGGVLALVETLVGIVVVGLCAGNAEPVYVFMTNRVLYLMVIAITCFITTFLVFVSNLCHKPTGDALPKTLFELLFNIFACLMYLPGAIAVLVTVHTESYYGSRYNELLVAAVFAIVNTILYLVSAIYWQKEVKVGNA